MISHSKAREGRIKREAQRISLCLADGQQLRICDDKAYGQTLGGPIAWAAMLLLIHNGEAIEISRTQQMILRGPTRYPRRKRTIVTIQRKDAI